MSSLFSIDEKREKDTRRTLSGRRCCQSKLDEIHKIQNERPLMVQKQLASPVPAAHAQNLRLVPFEEAMESVKTSVFICWNSDGKQFD